MGKTKVFELAKKLGLENKEMIERLHKAGIDAKSHQSVLEEGDLKKFEAAAQSDKKVDEERISGGIIRRRRKDTAPEVEAASPVDLPEAAVIPPVATPVVAPPPPEVTAVKAPVTEAVPPVVEAVRATAETKVAPVVAGAQVASPPKVESAVRDVPPAEAATPKDTNKESAPVVAAASSVSKTEVISPEAVGDEKSGKHAPVLHDMTQAEKHVPGRARILGRVELPPPVAPRRREEFINNGPRPVRPADQAGARPADRRPPSPRPEGGTARPPRPDGAPSRPAGPGGPSGAGRPGGFTRPGAPTGTGGPGSRPGGPPRPGGPGGAAGRPGGGPSRPGMTPPPAELFPGKEQRNKKKSKGKTDYTAGPTADGAGAKGRVGRRDVFEPDHGDRQRRQKRSQKPVAKKTELTVSKAIKRIIRISDAITVGELAKRMGVKANDLIKELMRQGTMVTINHPLDFDTAAILAADFQYEVENVAFDEDTILDAAVIKQTDVEEAENLQPRPPVVTIMGHVDHGKTSLLDAIRTANVTDGEAGGITQHIGAYDVELNGRKITFLDTPGHEAFTAMRSRGAKVTDIVILVVAADDGVMPQTREAINHAKAAGVPIVVAINKIDKPNINIDRVKQELTEFGLVSEDWGGETIFCEVSAKQRTNLEQLLEMLLLQAEVLDLKANPNKRAKGTIVEARIDRGRGPVATVLVQEGTLKIGDPVVSGLYYGRVRTMTDDRGNRLEAAGPSVPVEVTGLTGVPGAGDTFYAVEDERMARDVAQHREQKLREVELAKHSKISLEQLYARIQEGEAKELKVIIKGDVQGSVEAVRDSLLKLSTEACRLVVIHTAVGGIIESDITLASASDAIVLGFNIRPEAKAAALAESEGVDIRLYTIIYDAVADIRNAMEGLLEPTYREKPLGKAIVRDIFSITKIGTIAGSFVTDGKIVRNAQVRLVRDNIVVWTGKLSSLKRFKDDVREVASNYECGIGLENYNDLKVGDIVEAFEMEAIKTTL
ncbi:MAG: translation initiation factor IF-2 [Deltaproteobacteria bacterium HGW-Deltaproteobacteria-4]|nr:MAG: translation initiation factor IF-2 [Deltaproteobacteria bacterium HGW-Deltaproteobacteria-4]